MTPKSFREMCRSITSTGRFVHPHGMDVTRNLSPRFTFRDSGPRVISPIDFSVDALERNIVAKYCAEVRLGTANDPPVAVENEKLFVIPFRAMLAALVRVRDDDDP